MAVTGLDGLRERLGEPQCRGWARPTLWAASEAYLGLVLPTDYKAFLDLYGPGAVDGYVWLDRPTDGSREEAERLWHRGVWEGMHPDSCPWPFHPAQGGLLEWGHDEQGNTYFFLALEPDPDDWRVVVGSEAGEWFETAGPFTDFILRCFDRVDRPPFLDQGWPGKDARYHPLHERSTGAEPTDARTC
ncbi:SMI1/KNR4 family protein [Embleya sp. NPDC001921]